MGCKFWLCQMSGPSLATWPPSVWYHYFALSRTRAGWLCKDTWSLPVLEERHLAPSHPHAPQSSQGQELRGPPWGLVHTIPTALIQDHTIFCPGTIHALFKWTISNRVTQVIHSVWQSFTCKYFIFLLNIFGWLWILDVMRTLLCMRCRQQQGLGKEEKHLRIKNKITLQTTN